MNKCWGFQLVSKNAEGKIIARFTEPSCSIVWPATMQDIMGGYDPNGHELEIIVVEFPM